MNLPLSLAALCGWLLASTAVATSPYAAEQGRDIKALAPAAVEDYLTGSGMGLALAAELNGYPGPKHVLELKAQLGLTPEQQRRTETLFAAMRDKARELGRAVVAEEARLDRLFAAAVPTPAEVSTLTQRIGKLQGRLRSTHLEAHLAQRRILTSEQIARYRALRGYDAQDQSDHQHHH